jgi:hypothetical protein
LTRAVAVQHTVARQSLVAALAVVVGGAGVFLHLRLAPEFAAVAVVVVVAFALAWAVTNGVTRERAHELIASGGDGVALSIVARERRRLASRKQRERLAQSLEGYLDDAVRWKRFGPRARPPVEIRSLQFARREARDVARLARSEAPSPRGVAALSRFLTDGQSSSLFAGDVPRVRWDLVRIASLLEPDESTRRAA